MFPNFISVLESTDLKDMSYFILLICGGLLYVFMVLVMRLSFVIWKTSQVSLIPEFIKEFRENRALVCIGIMTVVFNLCLFYMKLETEFSCGDILKYLLGTFYFSLISVVFLWCKSYDEVDFALSQNFKISIGACWANGAVMAYYEESLKKFKARAEKFEVDNPEIKLLVKKLVLIAPLSCNIEGSLADRDEKIRHVGDLETIERDEGANINRKLKTPVYEIYYQNTRVFIAAEYPSPLGALWGERYGMDADAKTYIRDCFLKELKEQLQTKPVIILEYNDQNPSDTVPLNEFLISSLQNPLEKNDFSDKKIP